MPGPIPKRSEQRRRRNKPEGPKLTRISGAAKVKPPAEDKTWHIAAKRWYRSLRHSGQHVFYEPSDWAYAQLAADMLSEELKQEKPRAAVINQVMTMMDNLLTSEGARRRLRVELLRESQSEVTDAQIIPISPQGVYQGG